MDQANEDGLLAAGGDLSVPRLLAAYKAGIFPWYDGDIPLWWSPDPRFVLFPDALRVSKSMKQVLRKNTFTFTHNKAFATVIENCRHTKREGQDGTWITDEVVTGFGELFARGHVHSFEAWHQEQLVGGLYGVLMGQMFFGESMFSLQPNASKAAFIKAVQWLQQQGVVVIDCQVYTQHLESLGACFISRKDFGTLLQAHV